MANDGASVISSVKLAYNFFNLGITIAVIIEVGNVLND
jgi:hypothetical protein